MDQTSMDKIFDELLNSEPDSFPELDHAHTAFAALLPLLGPCALPSILATLIDSKLYEDTEVIILREALAKVVASDPIYQARSTPQP